MKRFWQEPAPGLVSPDALDGTSASLKRVRLSTSPGELRLEGDLRSLATFTRMDCRHWVSKKGDGALFERQFGDAMTFVLYLSQHTQVWMEFPRQYPHEPPKITRVIHPYFDHVVVTVQPAMVDSFTPHSSDTTIVYDQWSAVRRLEDFLCFLVAALKQSRPRDVVTPTLMSDEDMDMDMQDMTESTLNLQQELTPNRFDQGYTKKTNWQNMMPRGEKERELMNSDSY